MYEHTFVSVEEYGKKYVNTVALTQNKLITYMIDSLKGCLIYPKTTLAFLNTRIQAPSSPHSSGCHELLTVRKTRSGCGIMMATRPLVLESAVMPRAEPFGFAGYTSVGLRLLSMYCATIKFCA